MSTLDQDLEPFIDERINHNISNFQNSKKWSRLHNQFSDKFDYLSNNLDKITKEELENLHSLFTDLTSCEQYIIYKIGFVDGVSLRDHLGISQVNS